MSGRRCAFRVSDCAVWVRPITLNAMTACSKTREPAAETLFDAWAEALRSRDPAQVVALYADDAVLLPTISNQVRRNHAEMLDYFRNFLVPGPEVRILEQTIRQAGEAVVHTGIYRITMGEMPDDPEVDARFTFVYQRVNREWRIVAHHSSVMPEG
jgi:uncharacterized protein (TIGR02246 family)